MEEMPNGERIEIHERLATIETLVREVKANQEKLPCENRAKSISRITTRVKVHEAVVGAIVVLIGLIFGAIRAYAAIFGG